MNDQNSKINNLMRVCIGLTMIVFPLIFVFAFANHPNLFNPKFLDPQGLILRVHNNQVLHFGHALVTLCTGLLVAAAVHFMGLLKNSKGQWYGFIGGCLGILGALLLAADKGALCLTMSALDNIPESEFVKMMPGLLAIFEKQGWVILIQGLVLLPIGFILLAIGLMKAKRLAKWQCILLIIAMLFIGTPDGVEIVNLTASVLMTIALLPYGIKLVMNNAAQIE